MNLLERGAEHLRAGSKEMEWFEVFRTRVRGLPGDGLAPERINHYFVPRLFADIATADMIDDVVPVTMARRLPPCIDSFGTISAG